MQPLYTSAGGYVFGRNAEGDYDPTDLGVGNPASLEAAKKISALGQAGSKVLSTSISGDNSIALFAAGKAPFLLSGPWAQGDVEKAGFGYEIQPVPGFEGLGPAKPFAGVQAFFVASKGKNKAFAQEFVAEHDEHPRGDADHVRHGEPPAGAHGAAGERGRDRPRPQGLPRRRQRR